MHDLHRALAVWRQDPVVSVYWPRDGKHLHVFCILYPNTHATRIFFEPYWLFSLPPSLFLSCFLTFMFSSLCLPVQFMPVTDIVFGWVVMAICSPETFKPWLWELWNLFCCQYFFFFSFRWFEVLVSQFSKATSSAAEEETVLRADVHVWSTLGVG